MNRPNWILPVAMLSGLLPACLAQQSPILICNTYASPPIIRGEGITERVGDIVLNCAGGAPGDRITGNFSVFLNASITNRVSGTTVSGIDFTVDNGSGPQPVNVPGTLSSQGNLVYNGLSFVLSPTGTAVLRLADLRTAAIQLMLLPEASIQAFLGFNSQSLVTLTNTQLTVANINRALYAGSSARLICNQIGAALPSTITFSNLISSGAVFATTRITEGFADAFGPRSDWANLHADSGTRFIVRYSGFPDGAQIYIPDLVAGSDTPQPTGGGDFGVPASGGQYVPTTTGSLLLARVQNADINGAGGVPVFTPGAPGSSAVTFDTLNSVALPNGSGYAVYEVVDANANVVESAQFPTYLGFPAQHVFAPVTTTTSVFLAPVSQVETASATDPIPRFFQLDPPNDCSIVGDCGANYFPRLSVNTTPVAFTAVAGSSYQVAYAQVQNQGGGVLRWNATISYQNGSGWLSVSPSSGINNSTIRLDATPGTLPAGTYHATVLVDAGAIAGAQSIPVTLVLTAATPTPQVPSVTAVVNAATFVPGPVAPGSLATVQGSRLAGKLVAVTFNGIPATILFANDTQINVLVPAQLGSAASSQVIVTADGQSGSAQTVSLAGMAPGIFPGAILNQDYSANEANHAAAVGSVIQIFATGLSGPGAITARLNGRDVSVPYYAGPAPGFEGVQQVDLVLPQDLSAATVDVAVCGGSGAQAVCSAPAHVTIAQ